MTMSEDQTHLIHAIEHLAAARTELDMVRKEDRPMAVKHSIGLITDSIRETASIIR